MTNASPRDIKIGTAFLLSVIIAIMCCIVGLALSSPKMSECEPAGGKLVYIQGRNVCLSKELLEQLRKEDNEDHSTAGRGHSH